MTKMFWLEPGPLSQAERNVVYLCRPEVKFMRIIAGQSVSHVVDVLGRSPLQPTSFTYTTKAYQRCSGGKRLVSAGASRPEPRVVRELLRQGRVRTST